MVVELALILGRNTVGAVHLCHLLKRVEDDTCYALIRAVNDLTDLEAVCPAKLTLKGVDKDLALRTQ